MGFLRRAFYLLLGFTFPGFWLFHAGGLLASLYLPLQTLPYQGNRMAIIYHRLPALYRGNYPL